MKDQDFMLDIPMCVYNHEKYIARAIEGVLEQKTDFKYRLIIGEDCSTDNTRAIVKKYAEANPDKMVALFHEKNQGVWENTRQLLSKCTSKYIALCDGDDYWTSPGKLQKQVAFLEAHPEVAISAHNSTMLFSDGVSFPYNRNKKYSEGPEEKIFTAKDYITKSFFHTSSIVLRREALGKLPDWFYEAFAGDFFIVLLTAMHGDIHYINEISSVYRINSNSISNYSSRYEIFKNFELHIKKFDEYSGHAYHKELQNKRFLIKYDFYYYYPSYLKKLWFVITNLGKIARIDRSVISGWARYKIFLPTFILKSKVNVFAKKQEG